MRTSLALAAAGLLLIATPALAAREARPARSDTQPATNPAPVVVVQVPIPGPIFTPSHNSGSISSNASVSTNSGGNNGGTVVTGDEHEEVTVINIGPTGNNNGTVTLAPTPTPAPDTQCSGRTCLRTR